MCLIERFDECGRFSVRRRVVVRSARRQRTVQLYLPRGTYCGIRHFFLEAFDRCREFFDDGDARVFLILIYIYYILI